MVSLSRSKDILELGKRLVAQLDDEGDLLAAWMAHMIAERIHAAESAPPESKAAAEEICAKAVLELWRHREVLPRNARPLREFEPVLRTLQSLDVEQECYRYYPSALQAVEDAEAREDVRQWLKLAVGIDYTARLLIRFALRSAAGGMADEAASWMELARAAGAEEGAESLFVKFVVVDQEQPEEDPELARLRDKLARLESFMELAEVLAEDIRSQLPNADN